MPIDYVIDANAGVVTVTARGAVSQADDLACFRALLADRDFAAGLRLLLDYRERESVASADEARELAEEMRRLGELFGDSRFAIVVGSDLAYGMGRMVSSLSERDFPPVGVFRDLEEAQHWLDPGGEPTEP